MENISLKDALLGRLSDIFSDVKLANSLVDEGKEVHTSRRLQGVRTKMLALMEDIRNLPDIEIEAKDQMANVAPEAAQTE
jgi:hypothetical protein